MQKKVTKRKLQAEDTKNRILTVAKQLIKEHGFDNVSIDSVVKEAGISKGAFYVHFESKDELAAILIDDYVMSADLNYQSFYESLDHTAKVTDIIMQMVDKIAVVMETIGVQNMKVLYKAHLSNNIKSDSALDYNRQIYILFRDIIEKGIKQGEIKSALSPDHLAKHFVLALRGITFEWCVRYPELDLRREYMNHYQILIKGIV